MVGSAKPKSLAAFTLVELMVATGVVLVLAIALLAFNAQSSESVRAARSTADEFRVAQRAFETLTRRIGQATLNNYREAILDESVARQRRKANLDRETIPQNRGQNVTSQLYQRMSELRFACGPMQCGANPLDVKDPESPRMLPGHGVFFQATTGFAESARDPALAGLENLINTWGYFVEAGPDELKAPFCVPPQLVARRVAPRLMELREPADRLSIYRFTSGKPGYTGFEWFRLPMADRTLVRVAAENIAALIVVPKLTAQESARLLPDATTEERDALLAPELFYDSGALPPPNTAPARNMRHRLPPMLEITMIALDGATVARLYRPDEFDPLKLRDAFRDARKLREELLFDAAHPQRDSLERRLIDARAHYRLFTATVPIRSAQ